MTTWKTYPLDERYEVSTSGLVRMKGKENARVPSTTPTGYEVIVFSVPGQKHVGKYVHRIVMETFVGPCPPGMEVSHLDGSKNNNRLKNLTYETRSQNIHRKIQHNTDYNGARNPAAKLTESQVREIRKSNLSESKLGKIYNVSGSTVGRARRGESWIFTK